MLQGVKGTFADKYSQRFVVDSNDEVRKLVGIKKDLGGLLGGRETYVVDASGVVQFVYNDQFAAEAHATKALAAVKNLPKQEKKKGFPFF